MGLVLSPAPARPARQEVETGSARSLNSVAGAGRPRLPPARAPLTRTARYPAHPATRAPPTRSAPGALITRAASLVRYRVQHVLRSLLADVRRCPSERTAPRPKHLLARFPGASSRSSCPYCPSADQTKNFLPF